MARIVLFIGSGTLAVTDLITSLSKQLLETTDIEEAHRIARELQNAIRERVDRLHDQLRNIPKGQADTQGGKNSSGGSRDFGRMAA